MEANTKKKGAPPPRYDEAFKAGAVQMVTEQGREPKEVAKDLGICIDTLRSWMKTAGMQMGQPSQSGTTTYPGSGGRNSRHAQAVERER